MQKSVVSCTYAEEGDKEVFKQKGVVKAVDEVRNGEHKISEKGEKDSGNKGGIKNIWAKRDRFSGRTDSSDEDPYLKPNRKEKEHYAHKNPRKYRPIAQRASEVTRTLTWDDRTIGRREGSPEVQWSAE